MAQDGLGQQGFHAALMRHPAFAGELKHFPDDPSEMLQEIRVACVDLGPKRP
jgi:hypothetical protein